VLPAHLQDYWITKDVDMIFTRRFDICRLNVLLMNPNLVPPAVNVVIGKILYELKFGVELDPCGSNPQPIETDSEQESPEDGCRRQGRWFQPTDEAKL
jgi:hypothetical protein